MGSLIVGTTPRSPIKFCNHVASLAASEAAMYSDSQVDSATIGYLELFHVTAPPFNRNTQPDCEQLSSTSVWKLASVYPLILSSSLPPNTKNISLVFLKYLRIFFTAIQ
jgi:hypothetical protein